MSNFARAIKALIDVGEYIDHLEASTAYVTALEAAGLLAPDVRIIRTQEELEALDPDTLVVSDDNGEAYYAKSLTGLHVKTYFYVPAVVIASGAQVRAAREAMEKDNG